MVKQLYLPLFILALLLFSASGFTRQSKIPQALILNYDISMIAVSPSEEYVAYVVPVEDNEVLTIAKLDPLEPLVQAKLGKSRYVGMLSWVNDERLMLWPAKAYGSDKVKRFTSEVQAIDFDGGHNVQLWGYYHGSKDNRTGHLTLVNRLKDDPKHVMVSTPNRNRTRTLRKLNIYNGRLFNIEMSTLPQADFIVTDAGQAVMQIGSDENEVTEVVFKNKDGQWQRLPNGEEYIKAWVADEHHVILKHKDISRQLVKFNRTTEQFIALSKQEIEAFNLERSIHRSTTAVSVKYTLGTTFNSTRLNNMQEQRISTEKIKDADKSNGS